MPVISSGKVCVAAWPRTEVVHDFGATADGRQRNRRIEIALLPAINELPPLPASLKDESAPKK